MLLLLLALVQATGVGSDRLLPAYLALLSGYAAGERAAAVQRIRKWPTADAGAAVAALREHERDLRAVPAGGVEIRFELVEAAVVLHAEVGLLALQAGSTDAGWHLRRSVSLFEWSRKAAPRVRERGAARLRVPGPTLPKGLPPAFDVQERIVPRDFYLALAAAALAFGQGAPARDYAEQGLAAAPRDAELHLVLGCAAEYLADEQVLKQDSSGYRLRRKAESAFREALALDANLVEARIRLGHLLLADRRLAEAEPVLAEAEPLAGDERSRYLTRLFLGRTAERRGRGAEAAALYRRALGSWPSSQTAQLALAHALEKEGDPSGARAHVAASLATSRSGDRPTDPFWVYAFGPSGLAQATLDRLFALMNP